jgi:NAD(P) transhydrogenase subunit alpha
VEASAGAGVRRTDDEYEACGAEIVQDVREVFARADVVLKVKQPCFNAHIGRQEAEMIRQGAMLIAFLHPAAPANLDIIHVLRDRNVTSLTMDGVPRISRAQTMDALTSMSTVTGYRSVLLAATHLPRFFPLTGTAIGTVKPARVLVIGAGVVGLQAIATARRLGGITEAVDIRQDARKAAASLGAQVAGFEVPASIAVDRDGSAKPLPGEWLAQERDAIARLLPQSDVVISSALVPGETAPILIDEPMVARMRPGSVIIDVAIDQGGNCSLTKAGSETVHRGIFIGGWLNIPGSMPIDASWLYANNVLNFVRNLFRAGLDSPDLDDDIVRATLVTHRGSIVHQGALHAIAAAEENMFAVGSRSV